MLVEIFICFNLFLIFFIWRSSLLQWQKGNIAELEEEEEEEEVEE